MSDQYSSELGDSISDLLDMIGNNEKNAMFLKAVRKFGELICDGHEESRDNLLVSACNLDPDFAERIVNLASGEVGDSDLEGGGIDDPLEISSDDSGDSGPDIDADPHALSRSDYGSERSDNDNAAIDVGSSSSDGSQGSPLGSSSGVDLSGDEEVDVSSGDGGEEKGEGGVDDIDISESDDSEGDGNIDGGAMASSQDIDMGADDA